MFLDIYSICQALNTVLQSDTDIILLWNNYGKMFTRTVSFEYNRKQRHCTVSVFISILVK